MTISQFKKRYLNRLSTWAGVKVNLVDEFDLICQCNLDFIECLLVGEKEFKMNLLEINMSRREFSTINDFLEQVSTDLNKKSYLERSSRKLQFPYHFKLK